MLIVGTMIGAGFCSGRELVSFFGSGISVLAAPLCGVSIFLVCVLFLSVGAKIGQKSLDKVNGRLLGKYHFVADVFLLCNNLIVLSAMIAGFNSLCKPVVSFPVCGTAVAAVCAVISCKGAKGMLDCNFAVVPFLIAALAAVCVVGVRSGELSASVGLFRFSVLPVGIVYVSMNMMLASTVLTTLGALTRKQIIWGSALAAAVITGLMALLITAINCTGTHSAEMPLLEVAAGGGKGLYVLLGMVTGISIFTTMLTAVGGLHGYLQSKFGGNFFTAAAVVIAGTMLSWVGFSRVVSLFYPLVGVFGLAYIVLCVRFMRREKKPFPQRGKAFSCKKRARRSA